LRPGFRVCPAKTGIAKTKIGGIIGNIVIEAGIF
jgi:hypothetical protein